MQTYEMLRHSQIDNRAVLTAQAELFRKYYDAHVIADFINRADDIYHQLGLLNK